MRKQSLDTCILKDCTIANHPKSRRRGQRNKHMNKLCTMVRTLGRRCARLNPDRTLWISTRVGTTPHRRHAQSRVRACVGLLVSSSWVVLDTPMTKCAVARALCLGVNGHTLSIFMPGANIRTFVCILCAVCKVRLFGCVCYFGYCKRAWST
jgi:hypothetical protein